MCGVYLRRQHLRTLKRVLRLQNTPSLAYLSTVFHRMDDRAIHFSLFVVIQFHALTLLIIRSFSGYIAGREAFCLPPHSAQVREFSLYITEGHRVTAPPPVLLILIILSNTHPPNTAGSPSSQPTLRALSRGSTLRTLCRVIGCCRTVGRLRVGLRA